MALTASSVYGALTDHHRLIRQFGVAPLMYYLYGDNVIIHVREDPRMGSVGPSTTSINTHPAVERRMYGLINNFHLGLEIPMAVTELNYEACSGADVGQPEADCVSGSTYSVSMTEMIVLSICFGQFAEASWSQSFLASIDTNRRKRNELNRIGRLRELPARQVD